MEIEMDMEYLSGLMEESIAANDLKETCMV